MTNQPTGRILERIKKQTADRQADEVRKLAEYKVEQARIKAASLRSIEELHSHLTSAQLAELG